ncbi:MAG: universal stress protein [Patescibacteria group bacterium]|nr:universal stress protein [Patescibacteria group bacterium]MDE2438166.1 universal stress protein [Patescibacteria group bacterium]
MISEVSVIFQVTATADHALRYARDLASLLHVNLTVFVDSWLGTDEKERIARAVVERVDGEGIVYKPLRALRMPMGSSVCNLVVTNTPSQCAEFSCVMPHNETQVSRSEKGEIMIPFGDGRSGIRAASLGIPLARQLGYSVFLWHTTWRDERVFSADPYAHMCAEARTVFSILKEACVQERVPYRIGIDMADSIPGGIVRIALREHMSLICMARGANTGKGSYVDLVSARTPTPLVIVGGEVQ